MSKDLFDTDEKATKAIALFENLRDNEGWKLHVKVFESNIEVLKTVIIKGGLPEKELDSLRRKVQAYEECIGNPEKMIKDLSSTETEEDNLDPYEMPVKEKLDKQ